MREISLRIRAAVAKEVGVENPAEETSRYPNQNNRTRSTLLCIALNHVTRRSSSQRLPERKKLLPEITGQQLDYPLNRYLP